MMYLRIFLKVCEGCGGLWYRAQDCTEVYCPGCAARMRTLPRRRHSTRPGRRGRRPAGGAA